MLVYVKRTNIKQLGGTSLKHNRLIVWSLIFILPLSIILSNVGIVSAEVSEEVLTHEETSITSDSHEEDDILSIDPKLSNEEAVKKVKDTLVIGYTDEDNASSTNNNLILPTTGLEESIISWSSDKPEIIANDGIVTRPAFSSGSQLVTLTATISKGEVTDTKVFEVTVVKLAEEIAPVLIAGEVKRLSTTTATVKFTSSKMGQYYYEIVESGKPSSEIMETTEGNPVSTEEVTINLTDLELGAKDIYIIVKDENENVSEKLKIGIPEFIEFSISAGRHVRVEDEVFLGGKYIEVGISKSGSFGTKNNAPDGFHPINRSNLGFVFDGDGFDTENVMTSGDYFLPGSPYEGFIVGYKNEERPITFLNAERSSSIRIPSISIEDVSTEKMLAAKTTGFTSDDQLKVEQTVSFKENDKFFKMTVLITNNADRMLTDVRYMRSVDPDIDLDMSGTYNTINSVPHNFPSDSKSVALAKGPVTGNSLVLMSTDSRSRASLITSNPYSEEAFNDNGKIAEHLRDTYIGLTFALGNLAPGQTETIEYFYSLDSDIDQTIEDIENEAGPVITDEEAVANELEKLVIGYGEGDNESNVTNDLELAKAGLNGTQISWSSNLPGIINEDGTVNRPSYLTGDTDIILTATITKGDTSTTKTFKLKVIKLPITDLESVNLAEESLTIGYSPGDSESGVKQKLILPTSGPEATTITWSSNPAGSILEDGTVIRSSKVNKDITVTATISKNGVTTTKEFHVTILKTLASVTNPATPPTPTSPTIEQIVVDVDGENGTNLTKTPVIRTTEPNGTVKDKVAMTETLAKEIVVKAKQQGVDTARIVIPDTNDKVAEINVDIPKSALKQLNAGNLKLEIVTDNAVISIPTKSISGFAEDLYFRIVPMKTEQQRKLVEERAKKEEMIQNVAQNQTVQVLGRPVEIETNMQSREVSIVLPLKDSLPSDTKKRQEILDNLGVFIEHSDGTKELMQGKLVKMKDGSEGIEFMITKFSTFTLIYMDGWKEYQDDQKQIHKPYINGVGEGIFRPDADVTRAQMAKMLARNLSDIDSSNQLSYKDVSKTHWAYNDILKAKNADIMVGTSTDKFNPEGTITRAQMATIAYRWIEAECKNDSTSFENCGKISNYSKSNYKDVPTNHWAVQAISFMKVTEIMVGYNDGNFNPEEKLTRAQAVKVLNRIFKRGPLTESTTSTFKDVPTTHWAFEEIEEAAREHSYNVNADGKEVLKK